MADLKKLEKEEEKKEEIPQIESTEYELEKDLKIKIDWFYSHRKIEKKEEEKKEEEEEKSEEEEDEEDEELKKLGEEIVDLKFSTETNKKLILHWGIFYAHRQGGWNHPPTESYPPKTREFDKNALQTEFNEEKIEEEENKEDKKKEEEKKEEEKKEDEKKEEEKKEDKKKEEEKKEEEKKEDEKKEEEKKEDEKKEEKKKEEEKKEEEKKEEEKKLHQTIHMIIPRGEGYSNYIGGINFVFFEPKTNIWYNNYRQDYQIKFKIKINKKKSKQILVESGLYVPQFVLDVINCEANYGSWTLMHRYNKCYDIIQTFNEETSNEKYVWILIWLRYSHQRQLDWQRNYNTRPVLLSNSINKLSYDLTNRFSKSFQTEKLYKNLINSTSNLIKNILAQMGKGVGNGQEIRDEILHMIQRNDMHDCFYEEWHQKLHNNSTPDDIIICEAVIEFLKNKGNSEVYWKILKNGGITKERLKSYERGIHHEPVYQPRYRISDFENYLRILKSVHSATDLVMDYDQSKYIYDNNSKRIFDEVIRNKDTQDIIPQIKRVTEAREHLQNVMKQNLNDVKKLRDILFFELSLEIYARQLVEKIIHIKIDYDKYIDEINLILRNIKVSYPNFSEFTLCLNDWMSIVDKLKKDNSKDSALKVKSVVSRLNRLLSSVIDFYNKYFDARARYFGKECGVDNYYSNLFAEEMLRGSIFFALSMLLKKIEPTIRKNAQLSDWLIISRGKNDYVKGNLIMVKKLHEVQFKKYNEKTIIITENVDGNEEIPHNCVGLIIIKSENYPDILAHVSVRARNLNTLFCVCFNESKSNEILQLVNNNVKVSIVEQNINFEKIEHLNEEEKKEEEKIEKVNLVDSGDKYEKIFLELEEFNPKSVGAKSNNSLKIYKKIPDCDFIKYPESFAIPFNVHEYFLNLPENSEIKEEIEEYLSKVKLAIKKSDIKSLLKKCKEQTKKLQFVENEETKKLKDKLLNFGIEESEFEKAFTAIKSVWASKYNERVYIATSKVGITLEEIKMSVLCQKIIPSEYAYVIHTKNPMNNNKNEIFAEIVNGMGETLVGAYEGQSFSFVFNKDNKNYEIKSYQNKSISLKNKGFIFRSDSNTEDLEGFSGAGLFDSVPMICDNEVEMSYGNDKLFNDKNFVDNAIKNISSLGIGVEKLYNGVPQDIEGVYYNGDFYIVQTRPQV